jgi:hypothetical protein
MPQLSTSLVVSMHVSPHSSSGAGQGPSSDPVDADADVLPVDPSPEVGSVVVSPLVSPDAVALAEASAVVASALVDPVLVDSPSPLVSSADPLPPASSLMKSSLGFWQAGGEYDVSTPRIAMKPVRMIRTSPAG